MDNMDTPAPVEGVPTSYSNEFRAPEGAWSQDAGSTAAPARASGGAGTGLAVREAAPEDATWANWVPADEHATDATLGTPGGGPPGGGTNPSPSPSGRPRPGRRTYVLITLVVLGILAVGGVGAAIGSNRANAGSPSPLTTATSSNPPVSSSAGATALQQAVEQVASAVQPSVVEITSTGRSGQAIGSGDILTADGYIVTNDHVVTGFSSYVVTLSNGKTLPAQVVGEDAQDDLAVLKVSATGLKPIVFGDSSKAQVGEFVLALGNPLGLQQSATFGIVSALNRTASEAPNGPAGELTGLVQTSAPINPGNSGGALVDLNGDLIGIPTLGASSGQNGSTATGIGFAIPSNRVEYVATQLMQHGSLSSSGQGFLGIQGQDVTAQLAAANGLGAQSGVLVAGFSNDSAGASPAQQAGLRTGDIIVAVNGQQVSGNDDLAGAILNQQPGAHISLTIVRGTQQQTISVTLGERPANAQG